MHACSRFEAKKTGRLLKGGLKRGFRRGLKRGLRKDFKGDLRREGTLNSRRGLQGSPKPLTGALRGARDGASSGT